MPNTPSSLGEPVGLHGNTAALWLAPTIGFDDEGVTLPAADGRSDWTVPSPEGLRRRDAVRWKEVGWVGFAENLQRPPPAITTRPAPAAAPETFRVIAPVPSAAPEAATLALDETIPLVGEAVPAIIEASEPRRAVRRRSLPRTRVRFALPRFFPAVLAQAVAVVQGRQFRLAALTAAVVAIVVAGYFGGERLAGFAGAAPSSRRASAPLLSSSMVLAALPHPPPPSPVQSASAHIAAPGSAVTGKAARYLELAKTGEPSAEYDLGVLYARGDDGVAQDLGSAATWFRKAAQGGILPAAFNLGVMYERGLGVERDMDQAVTWYRRAAARNYPPAQYNLALAYAEGRGTPQDMIAAAHWYHDAAMQGLAAAMVNIAIMYEQGKGVARSLPDAYAWYRAAARRGNTTATQRARELFDQLNVGDKGKALMRASATADALHEAPGEALPAPSAGVSDYDPHSNLSPGGWLGGASAVPAAAHQQPSG